MELNEAIKALKWKVIYAKDIGESYTDCVNIEALDTIINILMILTILFVFFAISFIGISLYNERKRGRR